MIFSPHPFRSEIGSEMGLSGIVDFCTIEIQNCLLHCSHCEWQIHYKVFKSGSCQISLHSSETITYCLTKTFCLTLFLGVKLCKVLWSRVLILSSLRRTGLIYALSEFLFSPLKGSVEVNWCNFSATAAFLSKDWKTSKEKEFPVW